MGLIGSKDQWKDIPESIPQMNKFVEESTLLDSSERLILQEYLWTLQQNLLDPVPGLPWTKDSSVLSEYLRRVRLAVPKSDRCREIFRWSDDPTLNSQEGLLGFEENFSQAPRKVQIVLAHLYALFLFLWAIHEKKDISVAFHHSDIPYYMYQSEESYNSVKIEALLRALEKFVPSSEGRQNYPMGVYILGNPEGPNLKQVSEFIYIFAEAKSKFNEEKCALCVNQGLVKKHFARKEASSSSSSTEISPSEINDSSTGTSRRSGPIENWPVGVSRRSGHLCDKHKNISLSSTKPISYYESDESSHKDSISEKLDIILHRLEVIYFTQSKQLAKRKSK